MKNSSMKARHLIYRKRLIKSNEKESLNKWDDFKNKIFSHNRNITFM